MRIHLFAKKISLELNPLIALIAIIVTVGLVSLGTWQWQRADEKLARIKRIEAFQSDAAMSLEQVGWMRNAGEEINDLPVRVSGKLNNQKVFLLDNQMHRSRVGYRVFKVLEAEAPGQKLLVNLGWVPAAIDRAQLPVVDAINGSIKIKGNVRVPEQLMVLDSDSWGQNSWPHRIQSIDLQKIEAAYGDKLLPYVLYLDKDSPLGFVKHWTPIVMPPERHRAYSVQWFSLAIAWSLLMIYAGWKSAQPKILEETSNRGIDES